MGDAEIGEAILDTVTRVKRANPAAHYCCDPVIGDVGRGVFVRPGIPEFMRERAVPAADFMTPNQFELDHLTGRTTSMMADALAAIDALHALGPRVVMVTSLQTDDTPNGCIDLIASDRTGKFRVRTPRLSLTINGAGDAIAALFFARFLRTGSPAEALSLAASSIFGVLKRTADEGSREILLVTAQDEFVTPTTVFEAETI
jgi:pyridoxine kinase